MTINSGKTLAIAGNVIIGAGNAGATSLDTVTTATFTGGGTLTVTKTGGTFEVGASTSTTASNSATADLSGLSTFTANLGNTGTFRVGDNNPNGPSNGNGVNTLILAPTSTITTNLLGIGDAEGSGGTATINGRTLVSLLLGSASILSTRTPLPFLRRQLLRGAGQGGPRLQLDSRLGQNSRGGRHERRRP